MTESSSGAVKTKKFEDIFFGVCVVISFVLLCVILFQFTNDSIWRDEAYTYNI